MFKGRTGDCPGRSCPLLGWGSREAGRCWFGWTAAIDVVEGGGSQGPVPFQHIVIC